jgi:hypothetical protein
VGRGLEGADLVGCCVRQTLRRLGASESQPCVPVGAGDSVARALECGRLGSEAVDGHEHVPKCVQCAYTTHTGSPLKTGTVGPLGYAVTYCAVGTYCRTPWVRPVGTYCTLGTYCGTPWVRTVLWVRAVGLLGYVLYCGHVLYCGYVLWDSSGLIRRAHFLSVSSSASSEAQQALASGFAAWLTRIRQGSSALGRGWLSLERER